MKIRNIEKLMKENSSRRKIDKRELIYKLTCSWKDKQGFEGQN